MNENRQYILITGASSGIGKDLAILLSQSGYQCALVARNKEKLQDTIEQMQNPDSHLMIPFDLMNLDQYNVIFDEIKSKNIVLKGLVHCAGITKAIPLRALSFNNSIDLFKIHYFAFVELVKWYSKKGISEGGSIVGVSSINTHVPQKCMTSYAATKASVESACKTLAIELAEKNIRINTVVVGGIRTGMGDDIVSVHNALGSDYVNPVERQLLGLGTAQSISPVIRFLLSDDSAFITGREIYVDGGLL